MPRRSACGSVENTAESFCGSFFGICGGRLGSIETEVVGLGQPPPVGGLKQDQRDVLDIDASAGRPASREHPRRTSQHHGALRSARREELRQTRSLNTGAGPLQPGSPPSQSTSPSRRSCRDDRLAGSPFGVKMARIRTIVAHGAATSARPMVCGCRATRRQNTGAPAGFHGIRRQIMGSDGISWVHEALIDAGRGRLKAGHSPTISSQTFAGSGLAARGRSLAGLECSGWLCGPVAAGLPRRGRNLIEPSRLYSRWKGRTGIVADSTLLDANLHGLRVRLLELLLYSPERIFSPPSPFYCSCSLVVPFLDPIDRWGNPSSHVVSVFPGSSPLGVCTA